MSERDQAAITIALSPTQVDAVLRAAADERAPSIANIIAGSLARARDADRRTRAGDGDGPAIARRRGAAASCSRARSTTRGCRGRCCAASRCWRASGPTAASAASSSWPNELGMSPSTAHRYALTLVELGLLERCPKTRKYRLPAV